MTKDFWSSWIRNFGRTIVEELSKFEQEVIALDRHENLVQDVADMATKAAVGDITEIEFLKAVGIAQCDVVVIATGNTLESSVLAIMHCKKLGVKTILAKAKNATYEEVLYGIGATKVITPERDSGKRVASNMLRHHIENIIHIENNIAMIEFSIPDSWVGKSLVQLDLRHKYDLNLIGIRKNQRQVLIPISIPTKLLKPILKSLPLQMTIRLKNLIILVI